jgi:uncharacterized protein with ATP-grasp and redox domains
MENDKQRLDELAQTHGVEQSDLPRLQSKGITNDWWEEFKEWLNDFDILPKGEANFDTLRVTLQIFLIVAISFFVGYLIYRLIEKYRDQGSTFKPSSQKSKSSLVQEDQIEKIQTYLDQKNFSKAARVLWFRFLKECSLSSHLTPKEYEATIRKINPDVETQVYPTMFGSFQEAEQVYSDFKNYLLEERRKLKVGQE